MHLPGSQLPTQETGLRNSRGPYALGNWRSPSLTSGKVLWEKGAPRRNARLAAAGPNRSTATETRPRQPFHLRPAPPGRLRRFRAEPRLPEGSGARSPPSRGPAAPLRAERRPSRPSAASAGAWPGARPRPAGEGGAYLVAVGGGTTVPVRGSEQTSFPGTTQLLLPGNCRRLLKARAPASAHAHCGAPARASRRAENERRPPAQGLSRARARGGAPGGAGLSERERAQWRSRGRAWAGGAGGAQGARGPERGKEGPVTVWSDCQRPRPGSGRTEEKVRQTPVGCLTLRTQPRAERPRLLVGRGDAAGPLRKMFNVESVERVELCESLLTWVRGGQRAGGGKLRNLPRAPVLVPGGERPGRPAVTSGAWDGRS